MKNSVSTFICPSLILREVKHLFICLRTICIFFSIYSYHLACFSIEVLVWFFFFSYQCLGALYIFGGLVLLLWYELWFICSVFICLLALLFKFFVCFLFCVWYGCGGFAIQETFTVVLPKLSVFSCFCHS